MCVQGCYVYLSGLVREHFVCSQKPKKNECNDSVDPIGTQYSGAFTVLRVLNLLDFTSGTLRSLHKKNHLPFSLGGEEINSIVVSPQIEEKFYFMFRQALHFHTSFSSNMLRAR